MDDQKKNEPRPERAAKSTVLLSQGAPATEIISLYDGLVSLTRTFPDGRELPIMDFSGHGILGLPEVLLVKPVWCTCIAVTEVRFKRYTKEQFLLWLNDPAHPERINLQVRIMARLIGSFVDRVTDILGGLGVPEHMIVGDTGTIEEEVDAGIEAISSQPHHVISGNTPIEGMPTVDTDSLEIVIERHEENTPVPENDPGLSEPVFIETHVSSPHREEPSSPSGPVPNDHTEPMFSPPRGTKVQSK